MKVINLVFRAFLWYIRAVNTPLTEEEKAEMQIFSF